MSNNNELKDADIFKGDPLKFFSWSQSVLGKLTEENCDRYVTEGIEKPGVPDNYYDMPEGRREFQMWQFTVADFERKKTRWEDKTSKAYGIIFRRLSTVLQVGLKKKILNSDPNLAWNYLNAKYGTLNITGSRLELQKTMFRNLKMEEDSKISLFLIEYNQAALDAQIVADVDLTNQICKMGTLPIRFENACEAIVTDRLSWEKCQEKLELADERYQTKILEDRTNAGGPGVTGTAMLVGKDRPRNSRKDRRITMYEAKRDLRNSSAKCFQCIR
jgi:hypothetical protein